MRPTLRGPARRRTGFTIIELLVVVIVIGVLAAAGIAKYQDFAETAKKRTCTSNQRQIETAIASWLTQNFGLPKVRDGADEGWGWFLVNTGVYQNRAGRAPPFNVGTPAASPANQGIANIIQDIRAFMCPTQKSQMERLNYPAGAYPGPANPLCRGNNANQAQCNYVWAYRQGGANTNTSQKGTTAYWFSAQPATVSEQAVWCSSYGGYNCNGPGDNFDMRHTARW